MNANDHGLVKNFNAEAKIERYRLVRFGATEGRVETATDGTKPLIGATGIHGAPSAGDRIDVLMDRVRDIEFGGAVAQGDPLTADGSGRAIKATPAVDTTMFIIGYAMVSVPEAGIFDQFFIAPSALRG